MNNNTVKRLSNKNWHYIDLDLFESEIRRDERLKIKAANQQYKIRKRNRNEQILKDCFVILFQKFLGLMIMFLMIIAFHNGLFYEPEIQANDGTALIIILPVALFMLFSNRRWMFCNSKI